MRKLKLSPLFLMAVLTLLAVVPLALGLTLQAAGAGAALLAISAMLLERGGIAKHQLFGQCGEIGEDLRKVEAEYKATQASLKDVSGQLKAHAESVAAQIKKGAEMSGETKASVDKLLVSQGELNARLQAAEQALADGNTHGRDTDGPKSMGRTVVTSDDFKANAQRLVSAKGSFSVGVQNAITSTQSDSTDGYPVAPHRVPGLVTPLEQRLTIRDLLSYGRTTSNSIEYVRETGFTNNAAPVSENPSAVKPESQIEFEVDSAPVATIAHWIQASKQILSDAGMLQSHIDGRLRYGLKLQEEAQLLKGSGVGLNINGLYTQATGYSNPGVTVAKGNGIDRLRIAMLQVQLAEYAADGIVLNPIDWATIELTKDDSGGYIFANPLAIASPTLWGLPVVATQSMDQGDFMTGAFKMGAQLWDREDASVVISTEDRDNFVKNMVTILAEERIALTVYRPEAFVKGGITIGSGEA